VQRHAINFLTAVLDLVKGTYTRLTQHHVMTASVHTVGLTQHHVMTASVHTVGLTQHHV